MNSTQGDAVKQWTRRSFFHHAYYRHCVNANGVAVQPYASHMLSYYTPFASILLCDVCAATVDDLRCHRSLIVPELSDGSLNRENFDAMWHLVVDCRAITIFIVMFASRSTATLAFYLIGIHISLALHIRRHVIYILYRGVHSRACNAKCQKMRNARREWNRNATRK